MDLGKANQILRVAKMYYEENISQQEIAKTEEISKSTVSRLLKKAKELGYIKVKVVQPFYSTADIESEIKKKYNLKKVTVVPDLIGNNQALIRDINKEVIKDLKKLVKDGDTVGVAWGNTLTKLAGEISAIEPLNRKDVKVIQINGSASPVLKDLDTLYLLRAVSRYLNAEAYQVCAPALVDDIKTAELLKQEGKIKTVLDNGKNCDIAIFSAGLVEKDAVIFGLGCINEDEIKQLQEQGAIGDICSHFLKENGDLADSELDKRVIAVDLPDLKQVPEKILIVYGKAKAKIVKTILENGLADRVFMDEELAKALL